MPDDPKRKAARKAVKTAQRQFDRESAATQRARQKAFAKAQKEGLSLREIAEEVGLHRSRVGQIISGK
jgi:DNA-directed RNA polymerase specialized sigma24 family protein